MAFEHNTEEDVGSKDIWLFEENGSTTVISASITSGLIVETYDISIYTNYPLPESLINALTSAGVLVDSSSDMDGIYVK